MNDTSPVRETMVHREKPVEIVAQHEDKDFTTPAPSIPKTEDKEQFGSVRCKQCQHVVAIATPDGLISSISIAEAEDCELCRMFISKYDALLEAREKYASFKDRRDTHGPKVDALIASRQARIDLENWLLEMEAPFQSRNGSSGSEDQQHGTKRSLPESSTPENINPITRPTYERCDRTLSLPERKRIKFSSSVEFRDDYRPAEHFSRSEKSYQRGRYAPPEDDKYLDTSGSNKSFFKFTGYKKVGRDWVDLWKDDDDEETKKGTLKKVKRILVKGAGESTDQVDGGTANDRAQRALRRRSRDVQVVVQDAGADGGLVSQERSDEALAHVAGHDGDDGNGATIVQSVSPEAQADGGPACQEHADEALVHVAGHNEDGATFVQLVDTEKSHSDGDGNYAAYDLTERSGDSAAEGESKEHV